MSYQSEWKPVKNVTVPCRKCGQAGAVEYREWESSCGGHEDYEYRCKCGAGWWVEGADA